ncbi:MAG: aminotransferase class I/II-fold pyridoxal phosphate-dependent enzyme [Actinomycetes bacterium]
MTSANEFGFDQLDLERLRRRRSAKWAWYPADVLPAWVAEMDFPLAPPLRAVLEQAVALDDAGYAYPGKLAEAFVGFAASRFAWDVDPARVWLVTDVMTGVAEVLRALIEPGDGVVVNPPIYPPFTSVTREVGRCIVDVPLVPTEDGWELDLDGLEAAFAAGARAYLLCNPHNPTGRVFDRAELAAVAALAARYDVIVIVDEIHAPMTFPGAVHIPYVSLPEGAEHGLTITSASKAWNIAGLKCAQIVAGSERMAALVEERLPKHLPYHVGYYGVLASEAAFTQGGAWLDALVGYLDVNRRRLGELLEELLPEVRYVLPQAGYLAWLDCRDLDLGDDPAAVFLERGGVALTPAPPFGEGAAGFARLNFGTSSALVEEAVNRMAAAVR